MNPILTLTPLQILHRRLILWLHASFFIVFGAFAYFSSSGSAFYQRELSIGMAIFCCLIFMSASKSKNLLPWHARVSWCVLALSSSIIYTIARFSASEQLANSQIQLLDIVLFAWSFLLASSVIIFSRLLAIMLNVTLGLILTIAIFRLAPSGIPYVTSGALIVFMMTILTTLLVLGLVKRTFIINETENFALFKSVGLALNDEVTGFPNQKAIHFNLVQEQARFERYGIPYAIIILSVDDFQKIQRHNSQNDGALLVAIANALKVLTRKTDHLSRWSNEEFLCCLSATNLDALAHFCERLKAKIEELQVQSLTKTSTKITASFGVAMPSSGEHYLSVLKRAASALERAKNSTSKRIIYADGLLP